MFAFVRDNGWTTWSRVRRNSPYFSMLFFFDFFLELFLSFVQTKEPIAAAVWHDRWIARFRFHRYISDFSGFVFFSLLLELLFFLFQIMGSDAMIITCLCIGHQGTADHCEEEYKKGDIKSTYLDNCLGFFFLTSPLSLNFSFFFSLLDHSCTLSASLGSGQGNSLLLQPATKSSIPKTLIFTSDTANLIDYKNNNIYLRTYLMPMINNLKGH